MDPNLHRFYWNGADFFIIGLKIDENELTLPYKYFYMKKSGLQSKKTKKGKKRTFRLVVVNLLAMLAVVIIVPVVVLAWLDSYTNHGEACRVPNICGMQLDEAKELLRSRNLDLEIVDYKYKKGAAENEVVEQRPAADALVKEGRKIMLVVNSVNKPVVTLPSVTDNCSLREAEARLKSSGFVISGVLYQDGEKDWVYSVLCNGKELYNGESVARGSNLVLVVGNGNSPVRSESVIDEDYFE
jgi:beta-lactam-binding protein with PASTA domain